MKVVGQILLACFLLALLQYVVAAALAVAVIALLWGVYFRPRETFGLLAMILIFGLVGNHPVACIVVAGVAFVAIKLGEKGDDGVTGGGRVASHPLALPAPPGDATKPAGGDFGAGDG